MGTASQWFSNFLIQDLLPPVVTNWNTFVRELNDMFGDRHRSHTGSPSTPTPMTPMSYGEWKRETSAWDILFRLHLPYRPPRSKLAAFLWRRRLWVETTFALSMMQPWEKVVVGACCLSSLP